MINLALNLTQNNYYTQKGVNTVKQLLHHDVDFFAITNNNNNNNNRFV